MQVKKALIWSFINDTPHQSLSEQEQTISAALPIIEALFPGMNFFSVTGYGQVKEYCFKPVLKKLFPDLENLKPESVDDEEEVKLELFLASNGYEWYEGDWRKKFQELLQD